MELLTQRLRITEFTKSDIPRWIEIEADVRVRRFIDGKALSATDAQKYVHKNIHSYSENEYGRYAVWVKDTEDLIGMCGYLKEDYGIDFGYRFAYDAWGKGYASEAGQAVMDYGHTILGFETISAWVHPENNASMNVLIKLGFASQGEDTIWGLKVQKFQHKQSK